MAPNKRGGPISAAILSEDEVAARGRGTCEEEGSDSYDGSLAAEIRVFFTGVMFLTRLPVPAGTDHHPTYLMRSICYFPLIGAALVGPFGAAFFNAAAALWPRQAAAAAAVLATVWLTGCFHEDGLADCIDGFGGGWGRVQILRIMRDSRIGTYALVGTALLLHIKVSALAALEAPAAALVAAHCAARWTSLPLLRACAYLRDDEFAKGAMYNVMAASQHLAVTPRRALLATAAAAGVPWLLLGGQGALIVCATALVTALAAIYYAEAILGGVVGDYMGATVQITEILIYLALSARWGALAPGAAGAGDAWRHIGVLLAAVVVPVAWTRQIVDFAC